jgi:DNA-binding NtrC family response regulator
VDILLIDDDSSSRLTLATALRSSGHAVAIATDGNDGIRKLRAHCYDLVISELEMPGTDGFSILDFTQEKDQGSDVILMTSNARVEDAVAAIKQHASDYLTKPVGPQELVSCVSRIARQRELLQSRPPGSISTDGDRYGLVSRSPEIARVRTQIDALGPSEAPVLITGESGTGKELVARALHSSSGRQAELFVAINCASFPRDLLEAELFGHERGAFTGAERAREGRFSLAGRGTLLLDEISEMPLPCQAKLLRVLQEQVFSPLGSNKNIPLRARLVSATNRPLEDLVEARAFRSDLYYRVKVLTVDLPPLREREGDRALLCTHFLERFATRSLSVSREAWSLLAAYDFPGNVRELEHAIQHAVVLCEAGGSDTIKAKHLPRELRTTRRAQSQSGEIAVGSLKVAASAFERQYILRALALCDGNKTRASRYLQISRKNLWEKVRGHGISDEEIQQEIAELPPSLSTQ